ncbi:copper chaperone PCu(A)C [Streptomyces sp. HNM0574]|uniref:copper chaperone PCu(A)C n=1 Tax=Streptomyces sp. HNM0574 TaxID=2714954 RepID=UPI00146DF18B|nr:copper chaperone PCu(A)C [Streptomyces sp. HNM0574]NLU69639.1 copper chaperone PCu(A)C [Streptomyces sp. HNM0574]
MSSTRPSNPSGTARRGLLRRGTLASVALALTGPLALGACASEAEPELKVSGAYMPQPIMDTMAGGFLTVRNDGDEADELTSVTADFAKKAEMHETVGQTMQRVKSLPVPAHGKLKLARGGNHLMFHDLAKKPEEGEKVRITLHFEKSGPVKVTVPVKAANHQPEK